MNAGTYGSFRYTCFNSEEKNSAGSNCFWSSQKNSRRSTIWPRRRWNKFTATRGGRHLLLLGNLLHGLEQVIQGVGLFIARRLAGEFDPRSQFMLQIFVAALQKQADVTNRLGVTLIAHQTFDAGTMAPVDVKLQARMRMLSRQVHVARRHLEVPVDEMHQPVREVSREVRTVVRGSVLLQTARDVHTRIALGREFDVRIGFVIAQQDVVARLPLLDEIVFERKRFLFVIDLNEVDVARIVNQSAGFGVSQTLFQEVAAHAGAKVLRLADVNNRAVRVFVEIHS